jgi:sulfite exporter TauE/SafE
MLVGLVGASAKWFGVQQNISLAIGIGILVVLITRKVFPSYEKYIAEIGVLQNIRKILIPHINKKTRSASLIGGVVNGLLPCGLVYMALAGAIAVQEPLQGALFMILFGLGTLPMLLMAMVMGNTLSLATRKFLTQWYPILIGVMAIMLIVRGMNLGHMFSPKLLPGKNAAIHCIGE